MSKASVKTIEPSVYTPRDLATPNKDNNEVSKIIFMHISRLHNLLSNWLKVIDRGTKVCKTISALALHEYEDNYYPHQTKDLTESLVEALASLKDVVEGIEIIDNQLKALAKLQPQSFPIIITWSASQISDNVSKILDSIQKEYGLKFIVTENIAHCRDERVMEIYVSSWEFDVYFNIEMCEYLFAETGLSTIT